VSDTKDEAKIKPFSIGYVLRTTAKHMRKAIDISIRKTFERVHDFEADTTEAQECFETLAKLHAMRKLVDDFQETHKEKFGR
jgi:hypothetical protein